MELDKLGTSSESAYQLIKYEKVELNKIKITKKLCQGQRYMIFDEFKSKLFLIV